MRQKLIGTTIFILFAIWGFTTQTLSSRMQRSLQSSFIDSNPHELPFPDARDFDSAANAEPQPPLDITIASQSLLSFVSGPGFNYPNCAVSLHNIQSALSKMNLNKMSLNEMKKDYLNSVKNFFTSRMKVHERLRQFQFTEFKMDSPQEDHCVTEIRKFYKSVRALEDSILRVIANNSSAAEKPSLAFKGFDLSEPWLEKTDAEDIHFLSGDIFISQGHAAADKYSGHLEEVGSSYNQLAVLYVRADIEEKKSYSLEQATRDPNFLVLEMKKDIGATVVSFKEYTNQSHIRILHLRYPDATAAHLAARFSYNLINDYSTQAYTNRFLHWTRILLPPEHPVFQIPYNFKMLPISNIVHVTNTTLYSSQLAQVGFHFQNIDIPLFPSPLKSARENPLIRAADIKEVKFFAPGDLELDSRFQILWELRKLAP